MKPVRRTHVRLVLAALLLLGVLQSTTPATAQQVGSACSPANKVIYPTYFAGTSNAYVCDGAHLVLLESDTAVPLQKGIGTASPQATLDVNGEVRVGNTGLVCSATTTGAMRYNSVNLDVEYCNGTSWGGGGGAAAISALTAATAMNTIDNVGLAQNWSWNSLAGGNGLALSSNGTAALTGQSLLNLSLSGVNATGTQTTYDAYLSNAHTGTSTNVGLYASATGGSNNYAAIFAKGNVGIGTATPTSPLHINLDGTVTAPPGNWTGENISFNQAAGQNLGTLAGLYVGLHNISQAATTADLFGLEVNNDIEMMTLNRGVGLELDSVYTVANATNYYGIYYGQTNGGWASFDVDGATVTNNYGMRLEGSETDNTGTITNNYGIYLGAPCTGNICMGSAGSSIANSYGLYLENMDGSVTGATNAYAIYSAGGKSYFAGAVGIGTTSPAAGMTLGVNGNVGAVSYCDISGANCIVPGSSSASWSGLTNPTAALTLTMGANTSSFTYNAATGAAVNLFNLADTNGNTGTGYLLNLATGTGSALKPFHVSINGGAKDALTVLANGNVGIGTATPAVTMQLYAGAGDAYTHVFEVGDGTHGAAMANASPSGGYIPLFGGEPENAADYTALASLIPTGTDSGTVPALQLASETVTGAVLSTRPVLGIYNGSGNAPLALILPNGNFGIGTTTPQATLDVSNSSGSALRVAPTASEVDYLQITGGISGTPGVATLSAQGSDADVSLALVPQGGGIVNVNGHIETHGTAPTITACGTSPSVTGNDNTMMIAVGTGTVTACTITFNHYWQHIPICNVVASYNATGYVSGSSNNFITIKLSANGGGQFVGVNCRGWN